MTVHADVLLLNASNYPGLPIFPYAFVQVSAAARRHGLTVRRLDVLGIDRQRWPELLAAALADTAPRMVGVHVRQADSLFIWDYVEPGAAGMPASSGRDYFPVDDTRFLIETVRSLTDTPVVVGGFGFTTHAKRMIKFLEPDFGIQGEPDDFFAKFDAVLDGTGLAEVDNLIYRDEIGDYVFGTRVFYGPADHREYDEDIFDDLLRFYGTPGIFAADGPHVAVEVMRGCPYRCYFCTEPMVKGRSHRVRDLDVVMDEIAWLAARQVPRVWLICSEINIGGNDLLLELAERMRSLNLAKGGEPVTWSAYFLPNPALTRPEIRLLLESGFRPGWNQFMSYDDENIKKTQVPYRSRHALQAQLDWAIELKAYDERVGRSSRGHRLDMFLGNSFADAKTISTTLAAMNAIGMADYHDAGLITRATRVFDTGGGPAGGADRSMFSIGPEGTLAEPNLLYPTFHYPDDLVERLGSRTAVDEFFGYLEDTFFSHAHRSRKDWCSFLGRATTPDVLAAWCAGRQDVLDHFDLRSGSSDTVDEVRRLVWLACGDDGVSAVRELFFPEPRQRHTHNLAAYVLIELILASREEDVDRLLRYLELPRNDDGSLAGSEYDLLRRLAGRFSSEGELFAAVHTELACGDDSPVAFALRYYLYTHNLDLRPEYRGLLFHDLPEGSVDPQRCREEVANSIPRTFLAATGVATK